MSNKALVFIDPVPNFIIPEGELQVTEGARRDIPRLDVLRLDGPLAPRTFLEALARATSEPPLGLPTSPSFAGPGRPAFTLVTRRRDEDDFDGIWPEHCISGRRD